MKILNFGSLNLDYVYNVDHMVEAGETLTSAERNTFCGGKGLNQSIALARAGAKVFHAGQIGAEGEILRQTLVQEGVDTRYLKTADVPTGHALIQVDKNGQNCILLYGGANRTMTTGYIDGVLADFERGDILVLQNEVNLLDYIIDRAWEKGMRIILNPSPFDNHLAKCNLQKISILLLNEVEGAQLCGKTDPEGILEYLRKEYPEVKAVLTLGSRGSVYQDVNLQHHQSIFPVEAVDTTAAGDTFTGYFIAELLEKNNAVEGLETAAKAAAIAVTRHGAAPSIPTRAEVEAYDF